MSSIAHHLQAEAFFGDDAISYDVYLSTSRTSRQEAKFRLELAKRSWKKERPLVQREAQSAADYALKKAWVWEYGANPSCWTVRTKWGQVLVAEKHPFGVHGRSQRKQRYRS